MNSIDEAFSSVKQYCRKEGRISEAAMKLWIDIMKPVQLDGSVAVFTVQSEFQKTVVMNTYNALLKEAFLNVLGLDVKIQINVVTPEENDNPLSENSNAKDYDELARRHEELEHSFEGANYEYTFATFIAAPMSSPTLPAPPWQKNRARTTTPCSSTVPPVWERPT